MSNIKESKIAIIGGGLGGLVIGYELSKLGGKVTIFEKENFLGGLVNGFQIEGENLEKLYHHFFKTDKDLIELLKEIGLEKRITWNRSSTGLYWQKKMYPFNGAIDLLRFDPLSLIDKIRMGLVAIYLRLDNNWQKYEGVTAVNWMKKVVGSQAYKVVWEPLLKGKFHKYYRDISMAWLWARIHTRGNSKDEKGHEVLGYIDGGFNKLVERLVKIIIKNNGKIKLNQKVKNIKSLEKEFDLIIDTRPDRKVEYLATVNVVFSSEQSLSKFYWHNINDPKSPFLAFIQHTNLVGTKKYKGKNIYYLGVYVPQDHKILRMNDKKIASEWLGYLKKIFPKFDKLQAKNVSVFKFNSSQHIVKTNYVKPVCQISNKFYKINFAQIYPQDRGMNFAIKEAKKMVKKIAVF